MNREPEEITVEVMDQRILIKSNSGARCWDKVLFNVNNLSDVIDKLKNLKFEGMFTGKILDLRDCKAKIAPEYKARHDE